MFIQKKFIQGYNLKKYSIKSIPDVHRNLITREKQDSKQVAMYMKQKTVGVTVLVVTLSVVVLVISSFLYSYTDPTWLYYWCWLWLLPMAIWCWVVTAWCDVQLYKNAKPVGY